MSWAMLLKIENKPERKADGDMRQIKFKFRNQIRALKLYYSLCSVESFPTADAHPLK